MLNGCASGGEAGTDAQPDNRSDTDDIDLDNPAEDSDGDTISDQMEGRYDQTGPVDTDGDTISDYLDSDSDNDTIPDEVESGEGEVISVPVDSDEDTIPDFRDRDSDNNGIDDGIEGTQDIDHDGRANYADSDNDGDNYSDIEEIGSNPVYPVDTDRDGIPDYNDIDSDNDLITDGQEGRVDCDGDGKPNRVDTDSDGDGLTDAFEVGDDIYETLPYDSDGDGFYDFCDVDSDNDELGDYWEINRGLDFRRADTDADGYNDLVEMAADSDPLDPNSTPITVGNLYFIMEYGSDPVPEEGNIVFKTNIRKADIFFLMDTTGSMGGEIDRLKSDLSTVIIPQIGLLIEDVYYGVGGFDDYPVAPYGGEPPDYNDTVFYLVSKLTGDFSVAQAGVETLTTHFGGDCSESQIPALYAVATGSGFFPFLEPQLGCNISGGEFGYPCFRPGAVPVVLLFTDASFHNGPGSFDPYVGITPRPVEYDETITALRSRRIKVVGIISSSGGCGPALEHASRLASDTGTISVEGEPLVFSVSGSGMGLGSQVVEAVRNLSGNVPIDAGAELRDDLTDSFDARLFVESLYPYQRGGISDPSNPSVVCESGLNVDDIDNDTVPDIFKSILPGTVVCFHIKVRKNTIVRQSGEPLIYRLFIDVVGDDYTVLDSRKVIFLIPPVMEGPGVLQ